MQVCEAYRNDGGKVVVVLSQRQKLDLEAMYRCGIRLVRPDKELRLFLSHRPPGECGGAGDERKC